MLMGGAVDVWMLHLGRFLTGVAGGMTAASIPVCYDGCSTFKKKKKVFVLFVWPRESGGYVLLISMVCLEPLIYLHLQLCTFLKSYSK